MHPGMNTLMMTQAPALRQANPASSIKITERHYAPWVNARQERLEADVQRTWG